MSVIEARLAVALKAYFDETRRDGYIVDGVDGEEAAAVVASVLQLMEFTCEGERWWATAVESVES